MEHEGEPPKFVFKIVSHHRTALNRQVREAVRIKRRGGGGRILNSKAEYNRCKIQRLETIKTKTNWLEEQIEIENEKKIQESLAEMRKLKKRKKRIYEKKVTMKEEIIKMFYYSEFIEQEILTRHPSHQDGLNKMAV